MDQADRIDTSSPSEPTSTATPEPPAGEPRVEVPPVRFDAQGRIIPWTAAEHAQYIAAARQGMARIAAIKNDPGEDDRDFFRAMDESRPDRPLFHGLY